jgi:hypothetical protein
MRNSLLALILLASLASCVCEGPDRPVHVTRSTRIVFFGGAITEIPLECTPAKYTIECPFLAFVQRLTIEPITTDSLGRWALTWWAPDGVPGLSTQHISVGPPAPVVGEGTECLTVEGAGDNTGFRESYPICREIVDDFEQWTTTMQWQTFAVAGYSVFEFKTGLVY